MKKILMALPIAACAILFTAPARAQVTGTATTNLTLTINSEASLTAAATPLTEGPTMFSDFTGNTLLTFKIRTKKTLGTGAITMQVTSDFLPVGGPKVGASAGSPLSYTCSGLAPGTACTGTHLPSTTASTPVATFGADAKSAKAGNTGTVAWTLANDPAYSTDNYSATVTFTISAS